MERLNLEEYISVLEKGYKHFERMLPLVEKFYVPQQKDLIKEILSLKDKVLEEVSIFITDYNELFDSEKKSFSNKYLILFNETIANSYNNITQVLQNAKSISVYTRAENSHARNMLSSINFVKVNSNKFFVQLKSSKNVLKNLSFLSQVDKNVVILGPNGSGKSTFARNLNGKVGKGLMVIPAQKIFNYSKVTSYPTTATVNQKLSTLQGSIRNQSNSNFINELSNEFNILYNKLIAERSDKAEKYYATDSKDNCVFDVVIRMWNTVMSGSKLKYVREEGALKIMSQFHDIPDYDFSFASDGEKAIFYYIASILLAQEGIYVVIDEPENHLNLSVVNVLWDTLEEYRKDLNFIYLTHNVDFASSRLNTLTYWMKSFNSKDNLWTIEELEDNGGIPKHLLIELIGSRRKILFCEGDGKSSYDYKLYSTVFREYTVMPVGSHRKAIEYCKSMNELELFNGYNEAIAIIDMDDYASKTILDWRKNDVYTLPYKEIENMLLIEPLLIEAEKRFLIKGGVEKSKAKLKESMEKNGENSILRTIEGRLNNLIRATLVSNHRTEKKLLETVEKIKSKLDISSIIKDVREEHSNCINSFEYDEGLRIYNNKNGILHEIGSIFTLDYGDKIISIISESEDLRTLLTCVILGVED